MTTPAPASSASKIEGLDEAMAAVREKALADGMVAGYAKGRADAAKILAVPEAAKVPNLAAKLVGEASIAPEFATALITDAAKEAKPTATNYRALMEGQVPEVGVDADASVKGREARIAELTAIGKAARPNR